MQIRTPTGEIASMQIGGFVHDTDVAPSTQDRLIYAYVTPGSAALLGQPTDLDQLVIKMAYRGAFASAVEFASNLNAALKREGQPAFRVDALPATHPHAALMNAMLQVLGVLSAMALLCSSALAAYMVAATMRREVAQVGIMKTLGARSHRIAGQYLALVAPIALLAAATGFAAGVMLGHEIVASYLVTLNIDVSLWHVPVPLLLQEIAFAILMPLLAMAVPIIRAARMTPRAAMQNAGIVVPSDMSNRLASALIKVPGSMVWTFSLRNTWRRPWRLLVMVLALAFGGALLLMNRTNYESMMTVIDTSLENQGHDFEVIMQRLAPAAQLEAVARSVAEVQIAEAWRRAGVIIATREAATDAAPANESRRFTLSGYPDKTQLFKLPVVKGRAPRADASDEVLITRSLRETYPQLQLGKSVDLQFRDRRSTVSVVGMVEQIGSPALYTNFASFDAVTALGDQSQSVRVKARMFDIETVVSNVDQAFLNARTPPSQIVSRTMIRDSLDEHFVVVGEVMRMVAFAAALIGAIVLAATTSLNVLERTRETGIIRTLGATPGRILAIFLAEAAAITLTSALLAVCIALPLSRMVLNIAERTLLQVTVPMRFSMYGLALLGNGALIVVLTVWVVTKLSLRKSVRDAISYE